MGLPETFGKDEKTVNVVIETPYKSRNKFAFDEKTGMYKLSKVLPAGLAFPCDMGFIPGTQGGDEDPLDVLILMDELTFPGCIVECRLIGIIKAVQKEKGEEPVRNDRIVAVPANMDDCDYIDDIHDISQNKLDAIINFFKYYNSMANKKFKVVALGSKKSAMKLVKRSKK